MYIRVMSLPVECHASKSMSRGAEMYKFQRGVKQPQKEMTPIFSKNAKAIVFGFFQNRLKI